MKRLVSSAFSLLIAIYILGTGGTVSAQGTPPNCESGYLQVGSECILDGDGTSANTVSQEMSPAVAASGVENPPGPSTPKTDREDDGSCGIFGKASITNCLSVGVVWIIKNIALNIAGFLLWLTANMFDYAVRIGVLDFKSWAQDGLYPMWIMIRQVISLLVIFIGLYLGFMYILGKEEGFKRYVPWVIMFALFVNFSYPLVRTAIDISNVVSLNIYVSIVGPEALGANPQNTAGALIVSKLGLKGLVSSAVDNKDSSGMLGAIDSVPAALLAVCYVLYAAWIFFMVTFLFVLRTAALVFMIVASPLLLVDSIFPMLGEKAKAMRKIFFEQLMVAPVFMLMLAITVQFLDIFSKSGRLAASEFGGAVASVSQTTTVTTFFNILMMLVLLWIMLQVTKSTAGSIGKYVSDAVGTVGSFTAGAAAGGAIAGTGFLARKGIGGLAAKARDSKWVTNNQDTFLGKRAYNLSNAVASSTFDLRNTAVAQKYAGKLGISSGMGAGVKTGYDAEVQARTEQRKKDLLDRSNRIKTHYERDVYKKNMFGQTLKNEKGEAILLHRKGDANEEAIAAKRRFANNSGGALFLTNKQKEAVDDALQGNLTEFNSKLQEETAKDSGIDLAKYGTLKTQAEKDNFVATLKTNLEQLQSTDKNGTGKQSMSIKKTLEDIAKRDADEKAAFDKRVQDIFYTYNNKSGVEQENFLSNQSKEVHEAINKLKANALEQDKEKDKILSSGLDLDLSKPAPKTGEALRQERIQKVADGRAKMVNTVGQFIAEDEKNIEKLENRKKEIAAEYDKKIADLSSSATSSMFVDSYGKPMLSSTSQKELDEMVQQKNTLLRGVDNQIESAKQLWGEDHKDVLNKEVAKQQASAVRAQEFAENRNLRDASESIDVFNNNYAEKFAAARAAKQASAAQRAQAEMKATTITPPPGSGSSIPNPTTQAPTAPASNQSAYQAQTA